MSSPEGRLYGPLTLVLGLGLLAMGIALSLQMIAAVVGPFDFVAPSAAGRPSLGVWLPGSAGYDATIDARRRARSWRAALGSRVPVREAGSLEALAEEGVRALAVSDARRLSQAELDALERYLRSGGSVIVAGPVAVRGQGDEWRGTDAMARLLGVPRIVGIPRESASGLVAARRGPLSAGLAPGQRLAVVGEEGAPAIDDAASELRWSGSAGGTSWGASRRREVGAGRLVWLGAGPDRSAAGATAPGGDFARLAAAAFAWAAREPFAEVLAPESGGAGDADAAPEAADLAAELRRLGPRRHLLDVTNRGRRPAQRAVVRVHLNARVERLEVGRTVLQQDEPRFHFDPRGQHVDVRLPELAGRRSVSYTIDLDPAERAAAEAGG